MNAITNHQSANWRTKKQKIKTIKNGSVFSSNATCIQKARSREILCTNKCTKTVSLSSFHYTYSIVPNCRGVSEEIRKHSLKTWGDTNPRFARGFVPLFLRGATGIFEAILELRLLPLVPLLHRTDISHHTRIHLRLLEIAKRRIYLVTSDTLREILPRRLIRHVLLSREEHPTAIMTCDFVLHTFFLT